MTAIQSTIWQTIKIKANGIDIEVEDGATGAGGTRPVVLLIMGLGMQLVAWPPAPVRSLSDAGYRVIRHPPDPANTLSFGQRL